MSVILGVGGGKGGLRLLQREVGSSLIVPTKTSPEGRGGKKKRGRGKRSSAVQGLVLGEKKEASRLCHTKEKKEGLQNDRKVREM